MKINASLIAYETPEKNVPEIMVEVATKHVNRSSPSPELKSLLLGIARLHQFCHQPVSSFVSIENMKLQLKTRNIIRELFDGFDLDLSDWMLKLEKCSTESGNFTSFFREYLHHEFRVERDHSFVVLVLLNYISKFKLTPSEGFNELFKISKEHTLCVDCHCIEKGGNPELEIENRNLVYLRSLVANQCCDNDDDSDNDSDFKVKTLTKSSSDYSSESERTPKKRKKSPLNIIGKNFESNPFNDLSGDSADIYQFKESDTEVNPFDSSDESSKAARINKSGFFPGKTSSVKPECVHCQKTFRNSYNLKLHIVQVHRIFPQDMKIFECSQCDFVTGSRVCYTRHFATHSRKKSSIKVLNFLTN
eukprot:GFUD01104800.1.p1 GENE.GFUD01104800.1~~GFUD01104800.1.p1  ORF type:complete len:362 (+),score=62.67 GFUD01104800.1:55-1140(+)